ncbi:MAG: type II toxin-antitoxin system RelB/DinJ family antitoxin [Ruminococcus sp.]|nr:type II toxin-antitoxin system RelB/DinJ family antitoxin [Ruminococcus sp.]
MIGIFFTRESFVHICLHSAKRYNAEIIYLIDNVCTYTYNRTKIKQGVISNMSTTNINVRVDSALKQEAETLFNDLGLNMSSAINMFLRSAINHKGIPFEIKRLTPNAETMAALDEYEEMKKNPGNYKRYESFDEVLNEVFADA